MKNISQIVICSECGRKFDIGVEGGAYDKRTKHYFCNKCKNVIKKREAIKRNSLDGYTENTALSAIKRKKTIGIVLFCIGCLFFAVMLDTLGESTDDTSTLFTQLVVTALFFIFGCINILKSEKELKKYKENEKDEQYENNDIDFGYKERVENQYRCPNCGALTKGQNCEYCGQYLTASDSTVGAEIEAIETISDTQYNSNYNGVTDRNGRKINIWGNYPPIIDILMLFFTSGLWFIYMLYRSNKNR